jgi:hypothetical protein
VRREKPDPLIVVTSLENGIAIVIDENIIKGLLNCLIIINKALEKEWRGLTIDLASMILGTLRVIRVITKKINDFV